MKIFILLILIVGSNGMYWEEINDLQDIIKGYRRIAEASITSMEGIINTTRKESILFLETLFKSNPMFSNINNLQSEDMCNKNFYSKDNLNISFMFQSYQLEVPLQTRIFDIKERLGTLNLNADILQNLSDSKILNCQPFNNSCKTETKEWLGKNIRSLSCTIHPNCHEHSVSKRSPCEFHEFSCSSGKCIEGYLYCNRECDCHGNYEDCSDEPSGCVRDCYGFRCKTSFKCISKSSKCDGEDDCGDGSDEEDCPPPVYTHANCSVDAGSFLCGTKKCIAIELVCDGHDDCEDGTDEGDQCGDNKCSPSCKNIGGVCLIGPKGPQCLYECPPGTFETSVGCSLQPESIPGTLVEAIEDAPRLVARYAARFKYLKIKTLMEVSKSMQKFVKCKKGEFVILSKVIKFNEKYIISTPAGINNSLNIQENDLNKSVATTTADTNGTKTIDDNFARN